jgi:hypothetical protein
MTAGGGALSGDVANALSLYGVENMSMLFCLGLFSLSPLRRRLRRHFFFPLDGVGCSALSVVFMCYESND